MAPPPIPCGPKKGPNYLVICVVGAVALGSLAVGVVVAVKVYRLFNPPMERTDYR